MDECDNSRCHMEILASDSVVTHMRLNMKIGPRAGKILLIGVLLAMIPLMNTGLASIIKLSTSMPALSTGGQNFVVFETAPIESISFGTKVLDGDIDGGRMLFRFKHAEPVFAYWDTGPVEGVFDPQDIIYLHINDETNFTNAGDIRLTPYGYLLPGSRVAISDGDLNKKLTKFDKEWDIVFADQFGSTGYDLLDPVYLHLRGESAQIQRLDLRLSDSIEGPAGSLVDGLDEDRGLAFTHLPVTIRFYNANGNIGADGTQLYDQQDQIYIDISPGDGQGFVLVNDIRLT
jgi:hypothetical protein